LVCGAGNGKLFCDLLAASINQQTFLAKFSEFSFQSGQAFKTEHELGYFGSSGFGGLPLTGSVFAMRADGSFNFGQPACQSGRLSPQTFNRRQLFVNQHGLTLIFCGQVFGRGSCLAQPFLQVGAPNRQFMMNKLKDFGVIRPIKRHLKIRRVQPLLAWLRQCHRQFARRKPAIERRQTTPWLLKLDCDLDRLLLAQTV
jgi:hypothetical protein